MMAAVKRERSTLHDVLASGVDLDMMDPLDELSEALLHLSGVVARMRRAAATPSTDLKALDEVASRSIALTRVLRERLQARRARGEYNSASQVVREVASQIEPVLPRGVTVAVDCAAGPALVAVDRSALRRLLFHLVEASVEAMTAGGKLVFEVTQHAAAVNGRTVAQIEVRSSAEIDPSEPAIDAVRSLVNALGGSVQVRFPLTGGTAILVRMPSV
jgi:signal transduction histidine kinase